MFIKAANMLTLDNDNAKQSPVVNNGNAKECMEGLFAGFLDVTELGMSSGIMQVDRFFPQSDLTDKAL